MRISTHLARQSIGVLALIMSASVKTSHTLCIFLYTSVRGRILNAAVSCIYVRNISLHLHARIKEEIVLPGVKLYEPVSYYARVRVKVRVNPNLNPNPMIYNPLKCVVLCNCVNKQVQ